MNWNDREEWQRHIKVTIGIIIFSTLLFFTAINACQLPEQRIVNQQIKLLPETENGWNMIPNSSRCRL